MKNKDAKMKYDNNGKNYLIETKYKINDGTLDYLVPSDIKNAAEFVKWLANIYLFKVGLN